MNKITRFIVTFLAAFMVVASPITVSAADTSGMSIEQWVAQNCPEATGGSWGNAQGANYFSKEADGNKSQAISITDASGNSVTYYYDPNDVPAINTMIQKTVAAGQVSDKINSMTTDLGIQADTATATSLLSGAIPIVNALLGFLVLIINIAMFIFTALDIAYIVAPQFKEQCDNAAANHPGQAKTSSGGEPRFKWITDNAVYALKAANTVETGKNPLWIYLKSRVWTYMILAVVDFILLTGNITVFMNMALDVAEGVLNLISSIG